VPGTIWAPAWVTWAYTDDYIGWAPVPPSFVLSASGYSGGPVVVSQTRYVFVPTTQFVGVNVSTARVPAQRNATIFPRARKVTSYTVSSGVVRTAGPPASHIEKVTGKHLERVSIARAKTTPTTLADAGMAKGKSLHVAAPAKERAQIQKEAAGKRTENAPKGHASTETAKTTKAERSASAATREKKPKAGGEAKPRIERGEATTREKPAAAEHAKPRERGEKSSASAERAEIKREQPPRATAPEKPKTQKAPPAGQVKKEKPPQQEQGHGHGKKEKEKEKD
jgi:hypothetical protein